ncbi:MULTISPECIES: ACP S-malonyltransferase [Bacillus cereus group]|uniref:ACP S-malonyltransferase n=1 Tax=Bacillus cereus group TaxID=86661 RepID=UPI0008FD9F80|nr:MULTISPECIES: ACP S-malonyltransferase [Bacillus cereus group]MDG1622131.1 ACP S-malonyltransferase [Bacillus mobilis]MDX5837379.1 ACP S-malonyltransferase [Bacillus cereus group sp. BfR-BA-01700]MED4382994.1 ACP S-malonyltransferase [Bacillus mobilis]OJE41834.1 malonyl CoA-acyl carrier protein transacylase [Bacillus mobilis]HDR7244412.1 ACP S-malonyltransferase [Bacillus mobilis]
MERIALLFPGQGSQFVGMGKGLYDQYPIARLTFEEACDITGINIAKLCFEGSLWELNQGENLLPALLTTCVAAFRVYMEEIGIRPQICAGHSLGEYSALACSGAMTFADAVRITKFRGKLMQDYNDKNIGSMTILDSVDARIVERLCKRYSGDNGLAAISCYNSPTQVAISGHQANVEEVEVCVLDEGGQITPLMSSAPIHSQLMLEEAKKLRYELSDYTFNMFKWPVISNVTGRPFGNPDNISRLLTMQMTKPVQWIETLRYLQRAGVTHAIEIGPKNVLNKLTEVNLPNITSLCFGEKADRELMINLSELGSQQKKGMQTVITKCLAIAAATPNLNWDEVQYQEGVIQRYKRIQKIQEEVEQTEGKPTKKQMVETLGLLQGIFEVKKLPHEERRKWLYNIIDDTGNYYELVEFFMDDEIQTSK